MTTIYYIRELQSIISQNYNLLYHKFFLSLKFTIKHPPLFFAKAKQVSNANALNSEKIAFDANVSN